MLLKINNGKKEFSGETLFENVDFEVKGIFMSMSKAVKKSPL